MKQAYVPLQYKSLKDQSRELDRILLEFGLRPEGKYKLIVEGSTEANILEPIVEIIYTQYELYLSVCVKDGKKEIEHYLRVMDEVDEPLIFLDSDTPEKRERNERLKGDHSIIRTSLDHICFFYPDLVTENFTIDEILNAVDSFVLENDGTITSEEKSSLEKELYTNGSSMGYEKVVASFFESIFKDDRCINFSKPGFGKHLSNIAIELNLNHPRPFLQCLEKYIFKIKGWDPGR